MTDPSEPSTEQPTAATPPRESADRKDPLRRSRTSGAWTTTVLAAALLILLIVFIAQNTDDVHISFLAWGGTASLAVALLIATALGVIVTALVGTLRIWQLRRRVKRERV